MAETGKKKVVRAESTPAAKSSKAAANAEERESTWTPTPEAKGKAVQFRIFAAILWVLAIAVEAYAVFWILLPNMNEVTFETSALILLIGLLVVIGVLAYLGSFFWKKANRLDPASRKNPVRFFIQNQLGVIITIIAFVPLIILIFMNKSMDGKQKTIAGAIAIVLLVAVGLLSAEFDPTSTEDVDQQTQQVIDLTGKNEVAWTTYGKVYHLCTDVSDVNRESSDNTIFTGTVAEAIAAGKTRLTLKVDQDLKQCGFTPQETPAE